jgi:hypothetical protein
MKGACGCGTQWRRKLTEFVRGISLLRVMIEGRDGAVAPR